MLRMRAHDVLRSSITADTETNGATRALGKLAEDALAIIDAFARGVQIEASAGGQGWSADFERRLEIILKGIDLELAQSGAGDPDLPVQPPHVIQGELWQLLHKTRESAELSYSREIDLIELDRRILFLLRSMGPLVPADVASAVGVDKAQVSRSVKRLLELKMVEREQIRAPLRLTRKGETLSKKLMRLAELRNRELTFDIGDAELREFLATIEILLDRAVTLYHEEYDLAHEKGGTVSLGDREERKIGEKLPLDRTRIVSPLMTLSSYFSRSGALAFKRLTGLSNFEAYVLYEIGKNPPIAWTPLVRALERDHSQAGRTINTLVDRGLVTREGKPGRRHGRFAPSKEGARLWERIDEAGRERSAYLLAPLATDQRRRFLQTFEKIRRNAVAQLERERAFAELDD
ncbi:DNA-binding MarR family transcriptional regulator [Altererythrobacter atlanticus]|nr:MarR family transcriptional regulator [Croceibacterium atlanticum]MBB5732987.1 DNA-binding MarR family transcriptional regulator [Croceibacterium atlanticum]